MVQNNGYSKSAFLYDLFAQTGDLDFYGRYAMKAGRGLDIGAGTGRLAIPLAERVLRKPEGGRNVYLALDQVIQHIAEQEVEKLWQDYHPRSAFVVVMDPHTGDVLANAVRPTYRLDRYSQENPENFRNRAVSDIFEPGSTFKVVTAAALGEAQDLRREHPSILADGQDRRQLGPGLEVDDLAERRRLLDEDLVLAEGDHSHPPDQVAAVVVIHLFAANDGNLERAVALVDLLETALPPRRP